MHADAGGNILLIETDLERTRMKHGNLAPSMTCVSIE